MTEYREITQACGFHPAWFMKLLFYYICVFFVQVALGVFVKEDDLTDH